MNSGYDDIEKGIDIFDGVTIKSSDFEELGSLYEVNDIIKTSDGNAYIVSKIDNSDTSNPKYELESYDMDLKRGTGLFYDMPESNLVNFSAEKIATLPPSSNFGIADPNVNTNTNTNSYNINDVVTYSDGSTYIVKDVKYIDSSGRPYYTLEGYDPVSKTTTGNYKDYIVEENLSNAVDKKFSKPVISIVKNEDESFSFIKKDDTNSSSSYKQLFEDFEAKREDTGGYSPSSNLDSSSKKPHFEDLDDIDSSSSSSSSSTTSRPPSTSFSTDTDTSSQLALTEDEKYYRYSTYYSLLVDETTLSANLTKYENDINELSTYVENTINTLSETTWEGAAKVAADELMTKLKSDYSVAKGNIENNLYGAVKEAIQVFAVSLRDLRAKKAKEKEINDNLVIKRAELAQAQANYDSIPDRIYYRDPKTGKDESYSNPAKSEAYTILQGIQTEVTNLEADLALVQGEILTLEQKCDASIAIISAFDSSLADFVAAYGNIVLPSNNVSGNIPQSDVTSKFIELAEKYGVSYSPEVLAQREEFIGNIDTDEYTYGAYDSYQTLEFFYNGKVYHQNDNIVLEKGVPAIITVKLPTGKGKIEMLTRTNDDGSSGFQNYIDTAIYPDVDRYDRSQAVHTNYYDWVIIPQKTTGSIIISQTAGFDTDCYDGVKAMGKLYLKIINPE